MENLLDSIENQLAVIKCFTGENIHDYTNINDEYMKQNKEATECLVALDTLKKHLDFNNDNTKLITSVNEKIKINNELNVKHKDMKYTLDETKRRVCKLMSILLEINDLISIHVNENIVMPCVLERARLLCDEGDDSRWFCDV